MFTTIAEMIAANGTGANGSAGEAPPKPSAPPVDRPGTREFLRLADLVLDRRLQQRDEEFDEGQVAEIRESIGHIPVEERGKPVKTGGDEDALEVWNVHDVLYVVDGFQRYEAHRREVFTWVECLIYIGTWREAYERSFLVNRHGKQLTAKDKRHKLMNAVEHWHDEVMSGRISLNELSRKTNLSVAFISKTLRSAGIDLGDEITVTRGGQTYTMKTGKIGRPPKAPAATALAEAENGADAAKPKPASGGARPSRPAPAAPPPAVEPEAAATSGETSPNWGGAPADVWEEPIPAEVQTQPYSGTELVLNVPVAHVPELKDLVLAHGSYELQRALHGQLI